MAKNRRLTRLEKAEKKKKRNSIMMSSVLVLLMVVSLFAVFNGNGSSGSTGQYGDLSQFEYNSYTFSINNTQGNTVYLTNIAGQDLVFYSSPFEIENMAISNAFSTALLTTSSFVVTSEPIPLNDSSGSASLDSQYADYLANDLSVISRKPVSRAVTKGDYFNDLPIKTCEDSSVDNLVLVLNRNVEGIAPGIYETEDYDYCFELVGTGFDIIKIRDYIVYFSSGILQ